MAEAATATALTAAATTGGLKRPRPAPAAVLNGHHQQHQHQQSEQQQHQPHVEQRQRQQKQAQEPPAPDAEEVQDSAPTADHECALEGEVAPEAQRRKVANGHAHHAHHHGNHHHTKSGVADEPADEEDAKAVETQDDDEEAHVSTAEGRAAVKTLLQMVGEDTTREGLLKTPDRMVRAWNFCTSGYKTSVQDVVGNAIFTVDTQELVIVKDIDVYSMCEHHCLPFFGKVHIGYIPNGRVLGLSKFARLVNVFARRFQVQERLTNQIAECIQEALQPQGVAVLMEATHMCMAMRGVQKVGSTTVTRCMLGSLKSDAALKAEFYDMLQRR